MNITIVTTVLTFNIRVDACIFVAKLLCKQKFNSHLYQQLKTKNKIERREVDTCGKLKCCEISGDVSCVCMYMNMCVHVYEYASILEWP